MTEPIIAKREQRKSPVLPLVTTKQLFAELLDSTLSWALHSSSLGPASLRGVLEQKAPLKDVCIFCLGPLRTVRCTLLLPWPFPATTGESRWTRELAFNFLFSVSQQHKCLGNLKQDFKLVLGKGKLKIKWDVGRPGDKAPGMSNDGGRKMNHGDPPGSAPRRVTACRLVLRRSRGRSSLEPLTLPLLSSRQL